MACNGPLVGWRRRPGAGGTGVTFRLADGYPDLPVSLPCGKCTGCRMDRAKVWAARVVHEASLYSMSSFLTLTYADEHLPKAGGRPTLRPEDVVLFLKRLRKARSSSRTLRGELARVMKGELEAGVRFFMAGEYGGRFGRPHYHVVVFNCAFPDKVFWKRTDAGYDLYRSKELERLWTLGFSSVGEVTLASAGYVARYTLKKQGSDAVCPPGVVPEYIRMSRRPGVGAGWLAKFEADVFPADQVVLAGGRTIPAPRYYRDLMERRRPELAAALRARRALARFMPEKEGAPAGTTVEEVQRLRVVNRLKRSF